MELSKRANLLNVREVRGLVLADAASPTGSVGADWASLIQLRADVTDPEFWTFRGEASIVESPYMVHDMWGEFEETIREGAFDKTLSENPDVMFNYMHDPATTMATTRGGGLVLSADPHLMVEARVSRTDVDAQRVMPKVERGDASSMSFAFRVTRQEWNEDYTTRSILEVNLHRGDVASIVTGLGANPPAWGTVRSADALDADAVARWLADADDETRATILGSPPPEPEIDPDEARAFMAMVMRNKERSRLKTA